MAILLLLLALLPESSPAAAPDDTATSSAPRGTAEASESAGEAVSITGEPGEPVTQTAPLTIERLWSPAPSTARIEGIVAPDGPTQVQVIVDGVPVRTAVLQPDGEGQYAFNVDELTPGAQTLCLDSICGRVFVADPATAAPSEIEQRIGKAIEAASAMFDPAIYLPDWTIEIAGQNSNTGGYTDPTTRSIFISANAERSVEDLTITVLHEMGHAVDTTWMDDAKRIQFRALRRHDATLPWSETDQAATSEDRWLNSGEDFAEVFIAWVLDGDYTVASGAVAPQPSPAELAAFCELITFVPQRCDD